jgi:hypothetical protein
MFKQARSTVCSAALVAAALMAMPVAAQAETKLLAGGVCGPSVNSTFRTEPTASATNSIVFVQVPGAITGFTIAAGTSRCVKVIFTAKAACRGPTAVTDFCFIRATIDGVEMPPQGGGFQTFISEDATENAHAYMWITRVGAGNHVVRIERRVGNAASSFLLDDWTFDVSLYM